MICRIMLLIGSSPSSWVIETSAHAVLGEAADIELQLELVAEEAAEAVDDDHIERRRLGRGRVDHALELGPPVVGGRDAGLDVVGHDLPAARRAVAPWPGGAGPGWRGRCRPAGRSRPAGRGRREPAWSWRSPPRSVAGREQLVEQVAEPSLEHLDLGLGDGHVLGPVVGHGPGGRIIGAGRPRRRAGGRA